LFFIFSLPITDADTDISALLKLQLNETTVHFLAITLCYTLKKPFLVDRTTVDEQSA